MKKSIFNVALLAMLFVLGACSVVVPGGTGDQVIDGGLSDALDQIGSVEGMDIWSSEFEDTEDGSLFFNGVMNLYISANEYKSADVTIYDGTDPNGVVWNNEVVGKRAEEGTLATSTGFKLFDRSSVEITDLQGYTTLYTMTPKKSSCWDGEWEPREARTSYNIVSKVGDKLSMIDVDLKTTGKPEDGYRISSYETMDESIKNARTYTKK